MKIVVFGDVMLDVWTDGFVHRISPEAPVPVLTQGVTRKLPGGAANVATNLRRLGVEEVVLVCAIADDEDGHLLKRMLMDQGIDVRVVPSEIRVTTRKHRFTANGTHLLRVDNEEGYPRITALDDEAMRCIVRGAEAVIVSDYNKGFVDKTLCEKLAKFEVPFYVDPKQALETYVGAELIKPNLKEATDFSWLDCEDPVLCTQGSENALYFHHGPARGACVHFPVDEVAVSDVTGAGDAVLSALVVAEQMGYSREEAIRIGLRAGTLCVQRHGAQGPTKEELGLKPPAVVRKVVFTNGCFDIFHDGHRQLLDFAVLEVKRLMAAGYAASLLVAVNDDASVRRLKGETRPAVSAYHRKDAVAKYLAGVLSGMGVVWVVTLFSEDTPLELVKCYRPDVIVKGEEYRSQRVVGEVEIAEWGGRVAFAPMHPGVSTTKILAERDR